MRPLTEHTVDIWYAAVCVAFVDFNVRTGRLRAAGIRLRGDLAPAPSKAATASSSAVAPAGPLRPRSIDAKLVAFLGVARTSFGRVLWLAMLPSALGCLNDNARTVPLATAAITSACTPMVPLAPLAVNVRATWPVLARHGLSKITFAPVTAKHSTIPLALSRSALGAAVRPSRPLAQAAFLYDPRARYRFLEAAITRRSTVTCVLGDLAVASPFRTVAFRIGMRGPMRPLAERAIRWGFLRLAFGAL